MEERPHLLVLNQYYWPGREATAVLLTELCEFLAEHYEVTVVTGLLHDLSTPAGEFERNGVRVVRVSSTSFDRRHISLRGVNYTTFLGMSALASVVRRKPALVLGMTDPPVVGMLAVALARRWRVPVVTVFQDVFPEIAVALGRLENRAAIETLMASSRWQLRNSTRVVAIGETMRQRLIGKGARPESAVVIPNWANLDHLEPRPRRNSWSAEHGLDDKFVVMHSGNVGYAQDITSLVRAASYLRDRADIHVLIVGGGVRLHEVMDLAERLEVDSVSFLPYQPRDVLRDSLSSADIHVVGLARGLSGFVVPSRLYGVLAVGRPVIVAADDDCETAAIVRDEECGIVVQPGRPELLAGAIRQAADGSLDLGRMGKNGRAFIEREGSFEQSAARYLELLDELTGRRALAGAL